MNLTINLLLMSAIELREEINRYLDEVQDESFLKVVHSMLGTYIKEQEDPIIGWDIESNPLYASALKEEYAKRVEEMKQGNSTSIEALKKEASEW